jgi:hypothetical protein
MSKPEYVSYEEMISTASAEYCIEMLAALAVDLKNHLNPETLVNRMGAKSRDMAPEVYCFTTTQTLLENVQLTVDRLKQL